MQLRASRRHCTMHGLGHPVFDTGSYERTSVVVQQDGAANFLTGFVTRHHFVVQTCPVVAQPQAV